MNKTARTLAALAVIGLSTNAFGDVTNDCISANEHSIALRKNGKLIEAREQAIVCAATACPQEIQRVCRQRTDDVNAAIPSIVFEVKDAAGRDVVGVKVTIDGAPSTIDPTVSAVPLDPGEHHFRFEVPNEPPMERTFVLHEGEKQRRERVAPPSLATSATPNATPSAPPSNGLRTAAIITGVAGLVFLGAGATFGGLASIAWNNAKTACSPTNCPSATRPQAVTDHDNASLYAGISTGGLIGGGVLVAAGIVMFALAPRAPRTVGFGPNGIWGTF